MIIPLNRTIVIDEVIRWSKYKIASLVQCSVDSVRVKIESKKAEGDKKAEVQISFGAPHIGKPELKEPLCQVYLDMRRMVSERLGGLDSRRIL